MSDVSDGQLSEAELARIKAAPPVERDVGLVAGRRVYLMEWERDALVAQLAATKAMLAEVQWAASSYPEDSRCPVCDGEARLNMKVTPNVVEGRHHDGCELAALL